MKTFKVVLGHAKSTQNGPLYTFYGEGPQGDLESTLQDHAAMGWEPYVLALPTNYPVLDDQLYPAPVTLIFAKNAPRRGMSR